MTREQGDLCTAIARHFRIKRAQVIEEANNYLEEAGTPEHPVIELNTTSGVLRAGITKNSITLGKMLFFKSLEQSDLYSDLKDLFVNQLVDIVCFRSGGALLAAHQATDYNGVGGVLVKQRSEGYVFEPIATALNYLYPQYFEELL